MIDFSWIAVVAGGFAFFAVGAIWYSLLFQKPWATGMGIDTSGGPGKPPAVPMIGALLVGLVVAYVVEFVVRANGVGFGVCRGSLVGLAMAAVIVQNGLFDTRPRKVMWINAGFPLIGGVIVGAIAGAL